MVTFIILLKVRGDKITEIAEHLAAMPEISEVYSVTGTFDLVVIVRTRSNDDVADLVTRSWVRSTAFCKLIPCLPSRHSPNMTWSRCSRSERIRPCDQVSCR